MGDEGQVRLDPEMEEALSNATMKDIMELADILNTNPQDFVMEAYADPLQYFEPDPPNDVKPEEVLEKLQKNDGELKEVNLNNICGISEQLFCDIFNALKNNDKCVKFSACNCDLSDLAVSTLCAVLEENSQVKSPARTTASLSSVVLPRPRRRWVCGWRRGSPTRSARTRAS